MYWFYRLKQRSENYAYLPDITEQDVFIANSKEEAKQYLYDKFGKLPFRKPKECEVGTRYLWLTQSDEYWYKYYHEVFMVKCDHCKNETSIHSRKNLVSDKYGDYCSKECKEKMYKSIRDESEWIYEDDHVGIPSDKDGDIVGYIYRITNKNSMKSYVGQTIKPALFRWWQHLKTDKKFEQFNICDLVFEVIEIVTFNKNNPIDISVYENGKNKLNKREAYYINLFDCVEEGYNSVQPQLEIIEEIRDADCL